MWRGLSFMQKNLVYAIPVSMIAGLLYGRFGQPELLKGALTPLVFVMVYPMMVNLQIKKVFSGGDLKLQLFTQVLNFVVFPFVAYGLGLLFFKDQFFTMGMLLAGLLPTSGMTISWTGFARGNMNSAIKMTVVGLIAGALLAPVYAETLMGAVIPVPMKRIALSILMIVFIPMVLGYATRMILISIYGQAKYNRDMKNKFPMVSSVGVLGIVFVAMALKADTILSSPMIVPLLFAVLLLFYLILYTIASITGKAFFSREDGIALVYGSVMRNLSIALAIAVSVFDEEGSNMALLLALGYVVQVQSAAWYVRLADRIFGPAPADDAGHTMQEGIFSLHDDATAREAIDLLAEEHIHSIAVLSPSDEIKGILSAESIINHLASGMDPGSTRLADMDLDPVIRVKQKSPISDVIKSMQKSHAYKVIVTDESGKVTGVMTQMDVMDSLAEGQQRIGST